MVTRLGRNAAPEEGPERPPDDTKNEPEINQTNKAVGDEAITSLE